MTKVMTEREIVQTIDRIKGFHRKPINWAEVGLPIPMELLEGLRQYTSVELGISSNLLRDFTMTPNPTIFLVAHEGGLYLVNTEGSNYARYVRYVGTVVTEKVAPDCLAYVQQALKNMGYQADAWVDPLLSATFSGISDTGKEMYDITYNNGDENDIEHGTVYVWLENGKKVGDF